MDVQIIRERSEQKNFELLYAELAKVFNLQGGSKIVSYCTLSISSLNIHQFYHFYQ